MQKIISTFFIFTLLFFGCLTGRTYAQNVNDQKIIKDIETYFNSFQSLKGRFTQTTMKGSPLSGTFYLQRPGLMRFEYDPPVPITIIADGSWLIHYDSELEQASRALQSSTPADFFTRQKVTFGKDFFIQNIQQDKGLITAQVINPDEPDYQIILTFEESPLKLNGWYITSHEADTTKIILLEYETNIKLDKSLFSFISPEWEKDKKRN